MAEKKEHTIVEVESEAKQTAKKATAARKKVTEDGEEVEVESWGKPKWVAWFDGTDWHELTGAKVPGPNDAVESTPSDDDDDDDDAEGTDAEQEEEEEA